MTLENFTEKINSLTNNTVSQENIENLYIDIMREMESKIRTWVEKKSDLWITYDEVGCPILESSAVNNIMKRLSE